MDEAEGAQQQQGEGDAEAGQQGSFMAFPFPQHPDVLYTVQHEYAYVAPGASPCPHTNFLKGVKWSPDGVCMLTASDDGWLRCFDLPPDALTAPAAPLLPASAAHAGGLDSDSGQGACMQPWAPDQPDSMGAALKVHEGETIYDYCWYSRMHASDPLSCCFASTSRAHPVHLWDAGSGELRATYRGYNEVDEVTAAYSLAFNPGGDKLYAGYTKYIRAFPVDRPGRESEVLKCTAKGYGYETKLPGIVSCLAFTPDGAALAAGTYTGSIGIFDPRTRGLQLILQGHRGGLTQVLYTNDSSFLLSGARQDPSLLCWDLRMTGDGSGPEQALYCMERDTGSTNQRVAFSLEPCGRHVATGGCGGAARVFDLQTGERVCDMPVASDVVNGCDFHPFLPLLALATGQRRYPLARRAEEDSSSDEEEDERGLQGAGATAGDASGAELQGAIHYVGDGCAGGSGSKRQAGSTGQQSDGSGKRQRQVQGEDSVSHIAAGSIANALRVLRLQHEMVALPAQEAGAAQVAAEG